MKKLPELTDIPEDINLWFEETSDIKAFNQPEERPLAPLVIKEVKPSLRGDGLYNQNSFNQIDLGNTDNIDKNTASRFVKGNYKIEARIDLHGYTEKDAFLAVVDFIKNCYIQNKRCVLIITGKGIKKEDDPWYESKGVINQALLNWVNHPDIRPFILSIAQAKQSDGGSGEFYVLLKRQRKSNKSEIFQQSENKQKF